LTLFKLFGFAVRVDASWLLLAFLVTWSLAEGLFPHHYENLSTSTCWLMGIGGAVGLFLSIAIHELGHSLVARKFGIPIKDITLFIFGGVAEMEDEPPDAKSEFLMAIAGPVTSLILAAVMGGIYLAVRSAFSSVAPAYAVFGYLALLNTLLAGFNLLPAFPLDGGRVLRAALWAWRDNLRWATHIASQIGGGFGIVLIILGVLAFLGGNLIGGVWWFMIGMFMRMASRMSYQQLLIRRALEGEPVRAFMVTDPVTVEPLLSIRDLVENYIYKYHFKMYPVTDDGELLGLVTTRDVKDVPRDEWDQYPVRDIVQECSDQNCVHPDEDAMKALSLMNRTGNSRLLVVDDGRLMGIIALKDLLAFLSLKMDLEGEPATY